MFGTGREERKILWKSSQSCAHTQGGGEEGGVVNCNIHCTQESESLSASSSHFTPDSFLTYSSYLSFLFRIVFAQLLSLASPSPCKQCFSLLSRRFVSLPWPAVFAQKLPLWGVAECGGNARTGHSLSINRERLYIWEGGRGGENTVCDEL